MTACCICLFVFQEDGLFDHAQGNDFSMFDNLDSFLQEFGNSVSEPGLLSPSPALSDSGLSNTSSDQIMSPDDNGDDDLSEYTHTYDALSIDLFLLVCVVCSHWHFSSFLFIPSSC